jgi:hypothetical protein
MAASSISITWRDYVISAGFVDVGHYYRPPGLPQAETGCDRLAQTPAGRFAKPIQPVTSRLRRHGGSPSDDTLDHQLFGVDEQVLSMPGRATRHRMPANRPSSHGILPFFWLNQPRPAAAQRHPTEPNAEPTIVCGWADRTV